MIATVDLSLLGPAFLAGLLVLATHVPLGREVLSRGIIFVDLAVAQIAAVGPLAAHLFGAEAHGLAAQLAAFTAAIAGSLLLQATERRWPEIQEAFIGVLFVLAASLSILLLARNPQGGEHLRELLVGQILWTGYGQLVLPALVSAGLLAAWSTLGSRRRRAAFYPVFAVAVTLSVQLVGVYLVFASLILPALAVRGMGERSGLVWGLAVGAAGYGGGLLLSLLFDLPAGALIVWTLAMGAVVFRMAFAPAKRARSADAVADTR